MKITLGEPMRQRDGEWVMPIKSRADLGAVYDEYHDKVLEFTPKVFREKRSLDANAYFWVLVGKLAEKLQTTPDEIYRAAIKSVGIYDVVPIKEKAVERFCAEWCKGSKGKQTEVIGDSKFPGYKNVMVYHSSSEFDSAEMSRLIDMTVEECKGQGIETMTPAELQAIKDRWGEC